MNNFIVIHKTADIQSSLLRANFAKMSEKTGFYIVQLDENTFLIKTDVNPASFYAECTKLISKGDSIFVSLVDKKATGCYGYPANVEKNIINVMK